MRNSTATPTTALSCSLTRSMRVSIGRPMTTAGLVKRNSTVVRTGQVQVYLPGDIHDTRCVSETALLLRFTEWDLRIEDRQEHQVTRYQQRNGIWTVGSN